MLEFLRKLLDADFIPHGHCYFWQPEIVWLHVVSDSLITLAYYSIPVALVYFLRKRKDLPFNWMFLMFGAFIFACGTTHLMNVWTLWIPTYRLDGVVKLATAGLSLTTAVLLWQLIPKALALPSPEELRAANQALQEEISERQRIEEDIRRLSRENEERSADALRQSEEQLRQSQKVESIGRLAGGVAHDFNNLLTVINAYSDLLLHRMPERESMRRDVEEIRKAGGRAATLTRQLLAFSRRQILEPRILDLNAVVSEMEQMLRRLIGEDIDLTLALAPGLHHVQADPGQLEQVIMNLAVNARDAMPAGGKLTIETANMDLDEVYADSHISVQSGAYVMLAVSDTGCGMDREVLSHLFEPFFTTKGPGKGTGLGLSTVYGIVKQSGGYIWPYSEPRRGSTFKVYLPQVEGRLEAAPKVSQRAKAVGGTETILLAEDDDRVRELARRILEMNGYKVIEANRGSEALRICEQHVGEIHLAVTDVIMPQMSGRQLAQRLVRLRPSMRVLYMSGYTGNAIVHHGVLDPGVAFLQKPFTPDALARKVREVLDGAGPPEGPFPGKPQESLA